MTAAATYTIYALRIISVALSYKQSWYHDHKFNIYFKSGVAQNVIVVPYVLSRGFKTIVSIEFHGYS